MTDTVMRTACPEDLALMLDWAAAEGWNPGIDDAPAFHSADPGGFFVAEADGVPVAAISVVNHDAAYAFLGLYLCLPEWRGRGIGFALWRHALAHAEGRSVGLDGVAAQQGNYARSGFARQGATRRWQGRLAPRMAEGIRPVAASDLPGLIALDAAAGGVARPRFLSAWAEGAPTRAAVMGADGSGLAVARRCRDGAAKIGPVIAPDSQAALTLAAAALAALEGEGASRPAVLDVPEENAPLAEALAAQGFEVGFETARMWRGPAPAGDGRMQAIATMELG